jgi:peptidoglycan/xylan/chitin deacetylase (PgdA/CDA1 family)
MARTSLRRVIAMAALLCAPVAVARGENAAGVITHGPRRGKAIALTFDACMTPGMRAKLDRGEVASYYNHAVIDELRRSGTPATLLLSGLWIERYPAEAHELARDPLFEVGNHSYSHLAFTSKCFGLRAIPKGAQQGDMEKTARLIDGLGGARTPWFRFPGGCHGGAEVRLARSLGLVPVDWDVYGGDGKKRSARAIERRVLGEAQDGSIVLLHLIGGDNALHTAEAIPRIVRELRNKGYRFVKLSELLRAEQSAQATATDPPRTLVK